jgi:hypothetical protein
LEKYPIGFGMNLISMDIHPKKGDRHLGYSLRVGRDLTLTKNKRSKVEIRMGLKPTDGQPYLESWKLCIFGAELW